MLNKKYVFIIIFLMYLSPAFLQFEYHQDNQINNVYLGLPFTQTGDEPHYYITLYSLINDHDIFLTNNYNDINNNASWIKKRITYQDRHTRIFNSINKEIISFSLINETHMNLSAIPSEDSNIKEISGHPIGLPIFAFIFLWPFKNTPLLESLTIFLTLIFSFLGIIAFYKLIKFYHDENKSLFFTLLFTLATQYWHYSKTFWAEPYLASFLIISWYFMVVKKSYLIPGILLGFGFLIKYPFLLTILPFYIYLFFDANIEKRVNGILSFSLFIFILSFGVIYQNYFLTNSPLNFNQINAVSFANPFKGAFNWFFSPTFGLFTFSPILIFSIFGIRNFFRKYKNHCICLSIIIIIYTLFWVSYSVTQNGSGGYSARYLIPLIPFICVLISFIDINNKYLKYLFYIALSSSIIINFLSSFAYPAFAGYPILISIYKIIHFIIELFMLK